jgi:CheY-like chemotaxis protein
MGLTALYAEDDPNDVTLLKVVLRECQQPFDLRVVRDGEAAIGYLAGKGEFANRVEYPLPAVVILDIKMPGRSGFQVLAWIRRQPLLRSLPVIILSSSEMEADMRKGYALGANAYLVKSVRLEDLRGVVAMAANLCYQQSAPSAAARLDSQMMRVRQREDRRA